VRYGAIQEHRMMCAALEVVSEEEFDGAMGTGNTVEEIRQRYNEVKPEFEAVVCSECGKTRAAGSWDPLDVVSMARKVGGPFLQVQAQIATFVTQKYGLAPDVIIEDKGEVGSTCFRHIEVHSAAPPAAMSLYISPDRRFLLPTLLDLSLSPLIELQRSAIATQQDLMAEESPTRGVTSAPVSIVDFSDFQCPYCRRFESILSSLTEKERSNIKVTFKQLPLPMHSWARRGAQMAVCASYQGETAFWHLHDYLFANQKTLTEETVDTAIAEFVSHDSQLDEVRLKKCLSTNAADDVVLRDGVLASRYHITATPTIFINGVRQTGLQSVDDLRIAIKRVHQLTEPTLKQAAESHRQDDEAVRQCRSEPGGWAPKRDFNSNGKIAQRPD
jgi:protein-disulfide isomerase